jgi:hypothetical protein
MEGKKMKMSKRRLLSSLTVVALLLLSTLAILPTVSAAGPNYMGFTPSERAVTVGDSFRLDIYGNINKAIDTIAAQNVTFLPAGVVNYSSTAKGALFAPADAYTLIWHVPIGGGIKNSLGWAKYWLWAFDVPGYGSRINNSNATAFNVTWLAVKVGTATYTITSGGTAAGGIDPGTTKLTGTVKVHPKKPTAVSATMINYQKIDLAWTKQTGMDKTVVVYKTGSNPTSISDGTVLYNNTGSSTSHTGLSGGDHIYYSIWGWNDTADFYSLTYATADEQTNKVLTQTNELPIDESPSVDKMYPQVSVDINDPDGNTMTWTIELSTGGSNSGSGGNGTITCTLPTPMTYGAIITWFVNVTDGFDWTNGTYSFTVRSEYVPSAPTGFDATTASRFRIDLSWTNTDDLTYIEWSASPGPWARGAGTTLYNGTSSPYQHSSLIDGKTYYYQAWSWNETDHIYSTAYASDSATTTANTAPAPFSSEDPTNNSDYESVYNEWLNITVADADSDSMTVYFYWSNGTAIGFDTIASGGKASLFLPDYVSPDWLYHQNQQAEYTWYAIANDTLDQTQSKTWHFVTSYAWDVNENGEVEYLDVSDLVSNYATSCLPGQIGADIDSDGAVGYLDVSGLVSHYGEVY